MNVCLNGIPIEEGAWVRRPGTAFICTTRHGVQGRVIPFDFTDIATFTIELTQSHLRMLEGNGLVFDNVQTVTDVSTDSPARVTVPSTAAWTTGDSVQFLFQSAASAATGAILRNRQFLITVIDGNHVSLTDPVTGANVDGSQVNWDPTQVQAQLAHVLDLATPYQQADLNAVRRVQAAGVALNNASLAILLHSKYQPRQVTATPNTSAPNFSTFTIGPMAFVDGPYLDVPVGATITPSGVSNGFTAQVGYQTWSSSSSYNIGDFVSYSGSAYQSLIEANVGNTPNTSPTDWQLVNAGAVAGPNGFQAGDVGRLIRLLSEPAAWSNATGYSIGNAVKYNDAYYVAQVANSGQEPDLNIASWLPTSSTTVAQWVWGYITAVNSSSNVTVTLMGDQQVLLYNLPIISFRLGVYSNAVGWPTCGAYYQGRFWIGGSATIPNRFDASTTDDVFTFSPTAADGTVGNANGLSEVFNSDDQNTLYWMEPTASGLLCGTKKGEWLIAASQLQDPITPTSIQVNRVTKVGCFNQIPAHTPLTMVLIQRYSRLLFEVFPDLFSGKITAPNLNVYSKHLTAPGVAEIAYQSELAPVLWGRNNDGSLVGWTYRRKKQMSAEEPDFVGGHRHALGSGRSVASICVNSTPQQTSDSLMLTTVDPVSGVYHIEQMTKMLDTTDALTAGWYVDDAVTPSGMVVNYTNGVAVSLTFYGLWHLNGKTVSAVCGGLDLGDYLVTNGAITVPFLSDPGKAFTLSYIQSLNANTYGDLATRLDNTVVTTPAAKTTPSVINELILPQTGVTGASSVTAAMDFPDNQVFIPGNNGIRRVSLTNWSEVSEATYSFIGSTNVNSYYPDVGWAWTYGTDGYIYARAAGGSNVMPWIKVNASNYNVVATFGTPSIFWSGGPTGLGAPTVLMQMFGGQNYLAAGVQNSAFGYAIGWMNADTFSYIPDSVSSTNYLIENGFGITGVAGDFGALGATAYFISTPLGGTNPNPNHITLYTSTVDATGAQSVSTATATINASAIDPTWTGILSCSLGRDQKDGQLLLCVTGAVTGLTPAGSYICKLRTDGSFVYKTAIPSLPNAIGLSRATNGVLSWIGDSTGIGTQRNVYVFNTTSGTYTKYIITQCVPFGLSISNDQTGALLCYVQYAEDGASTTPQPGPNTLSSYTGWSSFTLGNVFQGTTSSTSSYTIPAVIGFTYTSQGQIVRPAQQGETGAQTGVGQGKTRRAHMVGILLSAAVYGTMSLGTVFVASKMRPALFKQTDGQTPVPTTGLFSGVYWSTIEDNYSFDGMIAWEITRPLPCTVVSISGFLHTQDR